jgi:ABC-type amino acid transport substrate-binding protein
VKAFTTVLLLALPGIALCDLPEAKTRGTLRVLMVPVAPSDEFFASQGGPRPGLDREILEGFSSFEHLKLEVVVAKGWDALVPDLMAGKAELIAGRFTATDARKKVIAFTTEVFPTRDVVLTRNPHRPVTTLEDLRKEKVGTIRGSSMSEAVFQAGVPASHVDDSIPAGGLPGALKDGRAGAVVLGIESAIAARRDDPEIELGLLLGHPGSLAYGVRKDEPELLKALDAYIDNVRHTATWNRLVVKYFGEQAPEVLRRARGD